MTEGYRYPNGYTLEYYASAYEWLVFHEGKLVETFADFDKAQQYIWASLPRHTVSLDAADVGVIMLLIDRLPVQAENVQDSGHVSAARYMRTTVELLERLKRQIEGPPQED
jgi:hypothetical protein